MVGSGLPNALHFKVTFDPSLTTISLDVAESSILGGTVKKIGVL